MFKIFQTHIAFPPQFFVVLSWVFALIGLFCWSAYLLSSPAYVKTTLELGLHFPSVFSDWGWFYGGICWLAFWKSHPVPSTDSDLSPKTSYIGFLFLLSVGVTTRFWHLGHFQGQYGPDQVMVYKHVENILVGNYSLLEPFGSRPPFSRFAVALLCKCLPGIEITTALRTISAFFDVIALAVFYWVGKSWASRRAGLLLMGLGLISRPMLYKAYWGIDYNLLSILVPLALGSTVWALQRPNLFRFFSWGLAVTSGIYVVTAYRPWIPILVSGTGWVLWYQSRKRNITNGFGFFYVLALTTLWFFVFFLSHNFIFTREILSPGMNKMLFAGCIFIFVIWTAAYLKRQEPLTSLGAWGLGSLLALGGYGIIASDPIFSPHVEILAFWKTRVFQADPWGILGVRLGYLWDFLALKGGDYAPISDPSQPFYDLTTGLAVLFALTRVLGKPTSGGLALVISGFLGLGIFTASFSPHSGRLYGCLFPFYALAAFALEDVWSRLRQDILNKWLRLGVLAVVFAAGTGALISNFMGVWNWMDTETTESIMARTARDTPPADQVYLVSSISLQDEAVDQLKGHRNAVWWKSPYKKTASTELPGPGIHFLVPAENKAALDSLKQIYPSAVWIGRRSQKGDPETKVWDVVIPGSSPRKG